MSKDLKQSILEAVAGDLEDIEQVMGTTEGKYRGIYTKTFMSEAMKAAGFTDISIRKKGKSLVATARKK